MPPLPVHASVIGGTTTPFIQPDRNLLIILNDTEVAGSGGFSTIATDNRISITFKSIFGTPISLIDRMATASSVNALSFPFPDTQEETGRLLSGPVEVKVVTNGHTTALIAATDLVALPPTTDATDLMLGPDSDLTVTAALAADASMWVPISFQGDPMAMPMCEGNFIYPVHLQIHAAVVLGASRAIDPLKPGQPISGYLADMTINGTDFYGMLVPQPIELVHTDGTQGVSICRLNDATNLVLRIPGNASWTNPQASPFASVASNSSPLRVRLTAPAADPSQRNSNAQSSPDSFGNPCIPGQR
ncbi:MAG: hypothetical protein HY270_19215 [Deltaproteobacteria bacterium]|nr:hypothetical protein [Deltaproteobacteria bacterium]